MIKTLFETNHFILLLDTYSIGIGVDIQGRSGYGSYGIKIKLLVFDICLAL